MPKVTVITGNAKLSTYWGAIPATPTAERIPGCKSCPFTQDCRRSVASGGPLLCERFLKKDLLPRLLMETNE